MLECVVNISEGRDQVVLEHLATAAGRPLLDLHSDAFHHRSVFTLGGPDAEVALSARRLARTAVELVDLASHNGAHPRFGAVDVVPFVALAGWPLNDAGPPCQVAGPACAARDSFAAWAGSELGLPSFCYGPARSLPEVRKLAWRGLGPDYGPPRADPKSGSVAVGCRPLMVAYNLWLARPDLAQAQAIARQLRSREVRALAFALGGEVQVSCNLLRPLEVGPAEVAARVAGVSEVARAELVGLVPYLALERVPRHRWAALDLADDKTIESRLEERGWSQPAQ